MIFVASQIWYREDGSKRRETLYEDGKDFGRRILIRINTFLKKIKPLLLIQKHMEKYILFLCLPLLLAGSLHGAEKPGALKQGAEILFCLLYTSPSPRDRTRSRMPSSA